MNLRPSCTRVAFVLLLGLAAASVRAEPYQVAQAEIRIPGDAQLERMEQQGIVTPPLYDGGIGRDPGIGAADRQMEEQAHRIDEKLLRGGICSDC